MTAKTLMVVGTMSSAGKSLLITGLCRLFARRGIRVAPFKSQNMSNNAGVCPDGSEIGRAQYTQALACGLEPAVEMNPILLKPEADAQSQVVLMGKPHASLPTRDYYGLKKQLWKAATQALDDLRDDYDLVLMEGAGSPVEMNLKDNDIVNMSIARYAQAPVLLAGDIDRGGIFAQLLGTLWLLDEDERQMVKGLLVNKFRGDISLFHDGIELLEERGGVPVLGVIPYIHHTVPEEDAVAIESQNWQPDAPGSIDIAIPRLPRISNFDDFDPLQREPGVRLRYIDSPAEFGQPDAVILSGTKSTIADMRWLESQGLAARIRKFAQEGGAVVGICGGYQMLGRTIHDPGRIESQVVDTPGLGLLDTETIFLGEKSTHQMQGTLHSTSGWWAGLAGETIRGYEIHMGQTPVAPREAVIEITQRSGAETAVLDGQTTTDGRTWGCYIHGLFENQSLRHAWLTSLGWQPGEGQRQISLEESFDQVANALESSLDMDRLESIIGL